MDTSKKKKEIKNQLNLEKTFKEHVTGRCCHCSLGEKCYSIALEYWNDPNSPYPGNNRTIFIRIYNPQKSKSKRQIPSKQQIYDIAVDNLKIENGKNKEYINVFIKHFNRELIVHYNNNKSPSKAGSFINYLIPSQVVNNLQLNHHLKENHFFICLKTKKKNKDYKINKTCSCNLFVNAPLEIDINSEPPNMNTQTNEEKSDDVIEKFSELEGENVNVNNVIGEVGFIDEQCS